MEKLEEYIPAPVEPVHIRLNREAEELRIQQQKREQAQKEEDLKRAIPVIPKASRNMVAHRANSMHSFNTEGDDGTIVSELGLSVTPPPQGNNSVFERLSRPGSMRKDSTSEMIQHNLSSSIDMDGNTSPRRKPFNP